MLNKAKNLIVKALEYNVTEAAFSYYMSNENVELEDIAADLSIHATDFKEGSLLQKLRECSTASEALALPVRLAEAVKRCYENLSHAEAEEIIKESIKTLKGHALLHLLS